MAVRPRLTLTFDNGPSAAVTPRVLDLLAERSLPAYFFVLGRHVARPDLRAIARRAHREGHRIGNHSMTHSTPLGELRDPAMALAEVTAAQAALDDAGLTDGDRLFRPFGGGGRLGPHLLTTDVIDHLGRHRHTLVLWNCVPRDWEDTTGWSRRARVGMEQLEHTVLVLHDLPTGAMDRLQDFLDGVLADGIEITADLPDDCVPMHRGRLRADLAPLTAEAGYLGR